MSNGPWPTPRDKSGTTFVTVAGVRWKLTGTDTPYPRLIRMVKAGEAEQVGDDETGKGL